MVGESMSGWQSGIGSPEGVLTEERPGTTHPDGLVDEQRRRRRAAEAAADAAEAAAADAAARASAAIAAAAAAAADAETAADLAARAAADAESAAAAERHAVERAHAINAVSANETTTVALAPVADRPAPNGTALDGTAPNGVRPSHRQVAVPGQALAPDEAAVARAATMTISATPLRDAPATTTAATGGRAARRRAQEAAAAAAREANRDPDTHVFTVDRESEPEAAGTAVSRRRRGHSVERTGNPLTSILARFRVRPGGRMVLVAAAVGGVVLVAAMVAGLVGGSRGSSNAAVVQAVPATAPAAAPTSAAGDPGAAIDPTSPRAVAFLKALRAADVPTSDSGQPETEAAEVICQQLAKGTEAAVLVRALPAVLPTVNSKQAKSVVSIAQKSYCS